MKPKNLANQQKHGISFEQAAQLFASSSDYVEIFDEAHSESEDRFIAIGPIAHGLYWSCGRKSTRKRSESSALAGPTRASKLFTIPTWMNADD